MDAAAHIEMKLFLMELIRTPVSEAEKKFGDPVQGLVEQLTFRGMTLDEVIESIDSTDGIKFLRLNGADLVISAQSKQLRQLPTVYIQNGHLGEYKEFLSAVRSGLKKYTDIRILILE